MTIRQTGQIAVGDGAGFIGSKLVDALIDGGQDVPVIDSLSTGYRHKAQPRASFAEVDASVDSKRLTSALHGRDVVFRTAAMPRVGHAIEDPVGRRTVTVAGALPVFKAAVDGGVRRLVYSSSCSAYDAPSD